MQENYKILGLTEFATDAEVDQAYNSLKEKYQKERFFEGEIGNEAAKQLTKLESAYREIKAERSAKNNDNCCFEDVERLIKEGNVAGAQNKLDEFSDRNAEWHYLQAVIFYKKNWTNESKKQLEIAMQMDPSNDKYRNSYRKLEEKMRDSANKNFTSYNQSGNGQQYNEPQQMGGDGCCQWCCEMAICNMMLNCFCNSCG